MPDNVGKEVEIYGWVNRVRETGRFVFVIIRDSSGIAQITVSKSSNDLAKIASSLNQEDVIRVRGRVHKSEIAKLGYEILPFELEVLARASHPLPLDPSGFVPVELTPCLNSRPTCLRRPEYQAIFRIQASVLRAIREYLTGLGYLEVITPKIIGFASEGGADLFKVNYFGRKAFLAQSPQLYKEMLAGAFERVFEIGQFYRAEKSRTTYHLAEFISVDVEEAFADMYDVMDLLEGLVKHVVKKVGEWNKHDLEMLNYKLPDASYKFNIITYSKAVELLKDKGINIEWGEDLGTIHMRTLGDIMGPKFYFIIEWPRKSKPFYTKPHPENPELSLTFDLVYEWLEIASGSERINDPKILEENLKLNNLDPSDFDVFLDFLRTGAPPHSGWGLGLSRLMMVLTGRRNIREVVLFPRDVDRLKP